MKVFRHLALLAVPIMLVACTSAPEPPATTESTPAATTPPATPAPSSAPRVFFVEPHDGAKVKANTPVLLKFGIENYELSAVPA
jgi:hypothetical protein